MKKRRCSLSEIFLFDILGCKWIWVFVLFAAVFQEGRGIKCYQCKAEGDCESGVCQGTFCYTLATDGDKYRMTEKGCLEGGIEGCTQATLFGRFDVSGSSCQCNNADFCNKRIKCYHCKKEAGNCNEGTCLGGSCYTRTTTPKGKPKKGEKVIEGTEKGCGGSKQNSCTTLSLPDGKVAKTCYCNQTEYCNYTYNSGAFISNPLLCLMSSFFFIWVSRMFLL